MAGEIEWNIQYQRDNQQSNSLRGERMNGNHKGWLSEHQTRPGSARTSRRLSSQRWCVINGQQLFVYDSQCEGEKPTKILHLPQFQVRLIVGDMDDDTGDEGQRSDVTDSTVKGQYLLELRPKQANIGDKAYVFAAETEEEFNNWGKLLSISAKYKKSANSSGPKDKATESESSLSLDDVVFESESNSESSLPNSPPLSVQVIDDSIHFERNPIPKDLARSVSAPYSSYTMEKAKTDFHEILKRADFTFWEEEGEEEEEEEEKEKTEEVVENVPQQTLTEGAKIESCLLAPSTKKSPNSSPAQSPTTPRRADIRWSSLPAQNRISSPTKLITQTRKSPETSPKSSPSLRVKSSSNNNLSLRTKSPKTSPTGSPSLRKRVSRRFGASWDRNSWGGDGSPRTSPKLNRKSWGLGSLSQADFEDSYGIFESRSSHRKQAGNGGNQDVISQENPVVSILLNGESKTEQENSRPRSATVSSSSSEEHATGLKPAQFNRTLSFITRMKEANKRKRKMRQIPISADDIVKPAKTGFVKISSKGKTSSIKSNKCYAVLKDDWLYLYKKPGDTCTLDAYDMPSYVVSANVTSMGIRNFKNQKLSISLEHKVTGEVIILTSEAAIEIFEWAEKLQKAGKEQGLAMAGLNLEQGRTSKPGKPFISAPVMENLESSSQSQSSDDQLAELHRHRLIQEAMKENQQLILGTQRVKEAPEQFPLGPSDSPSLQRKKEKLETKFNKASEEEEQQAMRDMTILKKRRISTQVKQDTILRQLEGRKNKRKQQREEEYDMMRKQLDELNNKLGTINSEIEAKSQHKAQKLQAIKERKAIEIQVLEQQNQLLRYRRATQEALENIMENAPVQRQSLTISTDDSSDDGERHSTSDDESYRKERSDSGLSVESVPGISLQRPSIDVGIPGPTFVLQRASLELQIGSETSQDAPVQAQEAPIQSQNTTVESQNAPASDSKKRGSGLAKTKRRLLPAIPGSPDSSRSGGSHSTNSLSGTESDNELQIVESADAKARKDNTSAFRKYRKSEGSPTMGVRGERLSAPSSGNSSPTTSDSGSDSPQQGLKRKNINRALGKGRSLPDIPSAHKRQSKDSTSSMDIASDESTETSKNSEIRGRNGSDQVDSGSVTSVTSMPRKESNGITNSNTHSQNSGVKTNNADNHKQSDANGNHVTSTSIYLRPTETRGKSKVRPMSEGATMSRLQVPGGGKKKQRSASETVGLRTEISPDVMRDIEDFEMMARKALREAGWQIPI